MSLDSLLKRNWQRIADERAGRKAYWLLSPTYWILRRDLARAVQAHARGRILDAGAGRMAHRDLLNAAGSSYTAVDVEPRSSAVMQADLLDLPFENASFETVFCSQVLEHVREPERAFGELVRVLSTGGKLLLSVPHLAYLHNEPHDYWRFTEYGLRELGTRFHLDVITVIPSGGLIAFLAHLPITLMAGLFGRVPLIGPVFLALNGLLVRLISLLDSLCGLRPRFALNHILIAEKNA